MTTDAVNCTSNVAALLPGTACIYRDQAPDGATLPFVVFSLQAGGPLNITPSDLRDEVYFVRGYGTTPIQAGNVDGQISALLHQGTITVTGYSTIWLVRETDLELVETLPDGTREWMAGAFYRISLDD